MPSQIISLLRARRRFSPCHLTTLKVVFYTNQTFFFKFWSWKIQIVQQQHIAKMCIYCKKDHLLYYYTKQHLRQIAVNFGAKKVCISYFLHSIFTKQPSYDLWGINLKLAEAWEGNGCSMFNIMLVILFLHMMNLAKEGKRLL